MTRSWVPGEYFGGKKLRQTESERRHMSSTSVPKRALILGGGGAVGVAWEIGLLAGLVDGGIDLNATSVVVGTSAGSVVGSHIASGRDPREMLASLRDESPRTAGGASPERDTDAAAEAFGTWARADEMTPEVCARVGAAALRAKTVPEDEYLANFAAQAPAAWP